mmetsp:Transcript_588/g.904  ORF Transcript_588/g.904 Transcript_588/m.904 type:complete len:81 (-) Transcript_588:420-662(-)
MSGDESCTLHGHVSHLSMHDPNEHRNREGGGQPGGRGQVFRNMAFRSKSSVKILYAAMALDVVQFAGWIFLLIALTCRWG